MRAVVQMTVMAVAVMTLSFLTTDSSAQGPPGVTGTIGFIKQPFGTGGGVVPPAEGVTQAVIEWSTTMQMPVKISCSMQQYLPPDFAGPPYQYSSQEFPNLPGTSTRYLKFMGASKQSIVLVITSQKQFDNSLLASTTGDQFTVP